jgi:lysozyme family protein
MRPNFKASLAHVLKQEGGWSDNPNDPGGATNHGITIATYREYVNNPNASKEDLRNIDPSVVESIYYQRFWKRMNCNDMPSGLDACLFDFGVNAGNKRAVTILQRAADTDDTGVVSQELMDAIKNADIKELIGTFSDLRRNFYKNLKLFPTFGKGWLARVDRTQAFSMDLANGERSS